MEEHRTGFTFSSIARHAADTLGTSWAFMAAALVVVAWALAGPIFQFSEAWQLVINTGTTIATFLMVFLIQNTQNRDARAIHLKLDELIRAQHDARNRLIDLESGTDQELDALQSEFHAIRNGGPGEGAARGGQEQCGGDVAPERDPAAGAS
jgi:low affinity Fe/Cu permease